MTYSLILGIFDQITFFYLWWFWGQPQGPNFTSPWATMLAFHLDCSTAALTTPQKFSFIWKLLLDSSDCTRTGISILTSAADDKKCLVCYFFRFSFILPIFQHFRAFKMSKLAMRSQMGTLFYKKKLQTSFDMTYFTVIFTNEMCCPFHKNPSLQPKFLFIQYQFC